MTLGALLEHGLEHGLEQGFREGLHEGRREGRHEGHREGLHEGLHEGLRKGRHEGFQTLFVHLLTRKFPDTPAAMLAMARVAPADAITRWSDQLLTATTLDEVFREPDAP